MARFKDAQGREWMLSLTVGDQLEIQRQTGVNVGAAFKSVDALSEMIFSDPATLVKTLWVLCEKQAKQASVEPEQFGYGFDGVTIEAATEALLEAIADFTPRSAIGEAIRANLKTVLMQSDRMAIEAMNKAIQLATSSNIASNSQASLE